MKKHNMFWVRAADVAKTFTPGNAPLTTRGLVDSQLGIWCYGERVTLTYFGNVDRALQCYVGWEHAVLNLHGELYLCPANQHLGVYFGGSYEEFPTPCGRNEHLVYTPGFNRVFHELLTYDLPAPSFRTISWPSPVVVSPSLARALNGDFSPSPKACSQVQPSAAASHTAAPRAPRDFAQEARDSARAAQETAAARFAGGRASAEVKEFLQAMARDMPPTFVPAQGLDAPAVERLVGRLLEDRCLNRNGITSNVALGMAIHAQIQAVLGAPKPEEKPAPVQKKPVCWGGPGAPTPAADESARRKATPVFSGVLSYFPDAIQAVARLSAAGSKKHNIGKPMHWAYDKSNDHLECIARHLLDYDEVDPETEQLHAVAVAWRALALLQTVMESNDPELHKRRAAQRDAQEQGKRPCIRKGG